MTNYARIIDGVAVDVSAEPGKHFPAALAESFVEVPDTVRPQWRLISGVWTGPAATQPQLVHLVTPVRFKLLFTVEERIAIRAAVEVNDAIADFMAMLDDPRVNEVDLALPSIHSMIDYLVAQSLIDAPRKTQILQNLAP